MFAPSKHCWYAGTFLGVAVSAGRLPADLGGSPGFAGAPPVALSPAGEEQKMLTIAPAVRHHWMVVPDVFFWRPLGSR